MIDMYRRLGFHCDNCQLRVDFELANIRMQYSGTSLKGHFT